MELFKVRKESSVKFNIPLKEQEIQQNWKEYKPLLDYLRNQKQKALKREELIWLE